MSPAADFYQKALSAKALFIAGLVIMPALLFNPSTEFRVLQFLFFWLLVFLTGRKVNPVTTILVIVCIIAFNLIVPYGRILFSIGPFRITSGALKAGIHRAVTFEALIMLSKLCIRQDLKIPGAFGEILGESLRLFSLLLSRKNSITRKNFITGIDNMMLELSGEKLSMRVIQIQKTTIAGLVILMIVVYLSWLPWLAVYLNH